MGHRHSVISISKSIRRLPPPFHGSLNDALFSRLARAAALELRLVRGHEQQFESQRRARELHLLDEGHEQRLVDIARSHRVRSVQFASHEPRTFASSLIAQQQQQRAIDRLRRARHSNAAQLALQGDDRSPATDQEGEVLAVSRD